MADTQAGASALKVHQGRYALRLGNPTAMEFNDSQPSIPYLQAYYRVIEYPMTLQD